MDGQLFRPDTFGWHYFRTNHVEEQQRRAEATKPPRRGYPETLWLSGDQAKLSETGVNKCPHGYKNSNEHK